jgi:phage tail sheath protein FI
MTPLKNLYNGANSSYSCAYANWVQIYDASAKKYIWMPFSGYQAAIMAKLDSLLYPWAAPMGLNNGIVRSVTNIAVRTNQKQQDAIYKIGINPVVFFTGDGITVWGQKTLQTKPSAFDRINVRRLFLTLERATMKTMRYFVAEPNTVFTRTRVINTLKPLFDLAKNNEGVYDYLLICSEKNNTPQTIDNNELAVDIYLKPVRTAEFIICTFYATRTDANFKELAG